MCGICGTVGRADSRLIAAMNASQAHRGPDGEGIEVFPSENGTIPAGLGHLRLSIIDPTPRGAQPMSYADGRYWVTYNGEIYNYRELRRELERDGFKFASDCDTEVLLALYARDGEGLLERINGIFAFAIWDTEAQELFLARDRLGVKPLYYAQAADGAFCFASEVKALLPALPRPTLRHDVLPEYLTFLWVPDPDTLFEGIIKLPPGHCARLVAGSELHIRQYWESAFDPDESVPEEIWVERVRDGVQEAVRRQMVSDVPLGAFLSGGLDSGSIVATMRGETESLTTYTVGFTPEDLAHDIVPDDLRYARRMASEFGLDYHEQILRPDVVDLLPKLVWHLDEPVADPAAISTYLICAAARERLTVILSGMGGDELFAGYPRHLAMALTRPLDALPAGLRRAVRRAVEPRLGIGRPGRMRSVRRNALKTLRGIDQPLLERYLTYSSYYRPDELSGVLSTSLRAELEGHDAFAAHRRHAGKAADDHWLNQLLHVDLKTFLPCLNLTYTDKMSMAASTEVRVPLLDDEVVALGQGMPADLKLHGWKRKYALKRAMEGVLPHDVIWRPKAGFGAPVRAWLGSELQPMVDELLSPAAVRARGLFDPAAVARIRSDYEAGRADNALRIWALLVLELWTQSFVDAPSGSNPRPKPQSVSVA